jgi:PAS domain S-box-containing protein
MESFSRLANVLPEAMLLVRVDGAILAANPSAVEITQCSAETLCKKRLPELTQEAPSTLLTYLLSCSRSTHLTPGRLTLRRPNGTAVVCRTHGAMFQQRSDDGPALVVLRIMPRDIANRFIEVNKRTEDLTREITRRRNAEAARAENERLLRITLASIGDAVITTNAKGDIEFMNAVAEALTGWPIGEAAGRPLAQVFKIVNDESRQPIEGPVAKVLREGRIVGLANHTVLIRRDGSEHPIDDSAAPIRDEAGNVLGVVLVFHDVSERRRMELDLKAKADQLVQMDRRKDDFLAMLSHELRNPLAPLQNAVRILQTEADTLGTSLSPALKNLTGMMERQLAQLTTLVNDLLDVARVTRGQIRLTPHPVSLTDALVHAIEGATSLAAERGLTIAIGLPPLSVVIEADLERFNQILQNLLSNAIKFTDPGGRISLSAAYANGKATIKVADTGIGIPGELLPRIFDLFVQGDKSLARPMSGLGVGLSIVKTLVEMHGGTIEAKSDGLGKGSEFTVQLPAHVDTGQFNRTAMTGSAAHISAESLRIIIVDDNADAAQTLAVLLRLSNHQVETASTAEEAIPKIGAFRPTIALLDIGLPGTDGYQLARELRADPLTQGLVLIAVTGYGQEKDRIEARLAGFDHHLTKPVEPADLLGLLNEYSGGRSASAGGS